MYSENPFNWTSISISPVFSYAVYNIVKINNTSFMSKYFILPFYPRELLFLFGILVFPDFIVLSDFFGESRKTNSLVRGGLFFIWRIRLVDRSCHNFPEHVTHIFFFFG